MTKEWGRHIWFFFHSFAESIDSVCYIRNKDYVCNLLKQVCLHLPCPECSEHAKRYVYYSLHGKNIKTKDELKQYFYDFHNSVNIRTGKPIFNNIEVYKNINFHKVIHNFVIIFTKPAGKNFNDMFYKKHITNSITTFINSNKSCFNLK